MGSPFADPLEYYLGQGVMTDPGPHKVLYEDLPRDVASLCQVVQGLLLHIFWAKRYGVTLSAEREGEVQIRPVQRKLARLLELDDAPLTVARPVERRLVGNCRDFAVVLCSFLRHVGIPARARCGFGVYFTPGRYEDHWVTEYWRAAQRRWVLVDGQIDALQREALRPPFDPLDVPRDQFITGGRAWLMCRAGEANPDHFGIFEYHGLGFVRGNLVRDFLALNKIEILPWDDWGMIPRTPEEVLADAALMDQIAGLTLRGNEAFAAVRDVYARERRLHPAPGWQP